MKKLSLFCLSLVTGFALTALPAAAGSKKKAPAAASQPAPAPAKSAAPAANPSAPGMVWVNLNTKVYHEQGSKFYGKTKHGKYMNQADATKAGFRPAKDK